MATNLTVGGVENCHILDLRGWFLCKFDIMIPKTSLYELTYDCTLRGCGGLERTDIENGTTEGISIWPPTLV